MPDLSTKVGPLKLKNPALVASGTFSFGEEFTQFFDVNELGGIITKSVTLKAREGNPAPRLVETPSGLINSIGLENPGLQGFLEKKLPFLQSLKTTAIVSIAGFSVDEFKTLAQGIGSQDGIAALELNLSCPNVKGGTSFASDLKLLKEVVSSCRNQTSKPIIAKLSPMVSDVVEVAKTALAAGADALTISNTFIATKFDLKTRQPLIGTDTGGLSGPAILPIVLALVWNVHRAIPEASIIASGGIYSVEDALQYLLAGASAISIGTANISNPLSAPTILKDLEEYCRKENLASMKEIIGSAKETGKAGL